MIILTELKKKKTTKGERTVRNLTNKDFFQPSQHLSTVDL